MHFEEEVTYQISKIFGDLVLVKKLIYFQNVHVFLFSNVWHLKTIVFYEW